MKYRNKNNIKNNKNKNIKQNYKKLKNKIN